MNPIQSWTYRNDSKDYLDMQLKRNFILQNLSIDIHYKI